MNQGTQVFLAMAILMAVLLWVSLRIRRRERLVRDLPDSKVQGVFIGLVELNVTAESEKPLTSFLGGQLCVQYSYRVDEEWSHPETETYTDDKGQSQTRQRIVTEWKTIKVGGAAEPFYGKDDTGIILIRPEGAKFEGMNFYDQTIVKELPLYHMKAPLIALPGSTGRRRFVEQGIPLHAHVFLVGHAREREDVVAPEIAANKGSQMYLISAQPKKGVQLVYGICSWLALLGGLAACVMAGFLVDKAFHRTWPPAAGIAGMVVLYLGAWAIGWSLMVFNSLVSLRSRVRQGWSVIEVELKRRNDLIPNLASAVSGLSSHESGVQSAVAELRAQAAATGAGQISGLTGTVRAVAEKYPALVAQEGFSRLQEQLVETEQRIALARTYYNEIATHYSTRLGQVPDAWLASVGGFRAEPLVNAAGFERAPVPVNLSTAAAPAGG